MTDPGNSGVCPMRSISNTSFSSAVFLFVFYRCGRLRSEVIQYAVDARHFGDDSLHKMIDQLRRQMLDRNFHNVRRVDRADDAGPVKGN